jgi:hypothetical protein
MSPVAQSIVRRLDAARQQWWLFTLLSSAVLATSASFGTLLSFMLIDALLKFSQVTLAILFGLWALTTVGLIVVLCRRLARSQRSLEATARCVEFEFPELGSDLINLIQLTEDDKNVNREFCEAAISAAALRVGHVDFEQAAVKESRWRRFRYCMQTPRDLGESFAVLGSLIAIAVLCHLLIPNLGSAANRLMQPWQFVPSVGKVQIVSVKPGNAEVLVGSSVEITAEIKNPQKQPLKGTLFVTPDQEKEAATPLSAEKGFLRYKITLPSVLKPLKYRLEIGDSQTELYTIGVRQKPTFSEVKVTFQYPPYLGRSPETFVQKQADLEAPQFTVAVLEIRPSAPVSKGYIQVGTERYTGRVEQSGAVLVVRMPLLKDGAYTVHLFNEAGHTDPDPRVNRIHVVPDRAPTAELLKPGRQESAAPGASVPVVIRASDDHGLGRVRLEMKVKKAEAAGQAEGEKSEAAKPEDLESLPVSTVQEWSKFDSKSTSVLEYRLELPADKIKNGQTVLIRGVAWDRRDIGDWGLDLKAQEGASAWHSIRIVAEEAKAAAELEQLDNLRGSIWKILENQVRAQMKAAGVPKSMDASAAAAAAGEVRTQQVDIQKAATAVVKSIGETNKEDRQAIKKILNQLAFNEMLEAVQQCEELATLKTLDAFAAPVGKLNATQGRIIDALRRLLDAARQAQSETLNEMKKRPGGDLPDDTKKKLEEAKAKLDEFLKQQKKVIEASENLAKKPVEDFSEKDEQALKTLAANEADLSKFMKELANDLAKLPEQDFSNAAMAKELNEIQTELKMAEDALLKKSADIAVPLEQLGYEMAKEITSNMEKWLPDTPDREKWSQEESVSDKDKEAPMAELPGELEDLIGDLMEQEEDLFDEMEDVTSSAADSLDKGAGWDVADGPISNMSAKGATGNRLPNTSEIGGRSGEGRSGKSSGEFVGDEAVGKGGRKTPSRLTPDPIVKGQIKDHSKDAQGGASGGGKESGEGAEGLEGPGAPQRKREMNRLAGKQADLRNKAESVDLQHFQVTGYHHTDLQKMIETMSQIERDLKAGRYQNVMRERKVLTEGLGNVKQYLKGEFEVKQDTTVNLPTDIQKEIVGSMQDPSPAGWEELNRQYFERLATGGAEAGAGAAAPAAAPKK